MKWSLQLQPMRCTWQTNKKTSKERGTLNQQNCSMGTTLLFGKEWGLNESINVRSRKETQASLLNRSKRKIKPESNQINGPDDTVWKAKPQLFRATQTTLQVGEPKHVTSQRDFGSMRATACKFTRATDCAKTSPVLGQRVAQQLALTFWKAMESLRGWVNGA